MQHKRHDVWFWGGVFRVNQSTGATFDFHKFKMAAEWRLSWIYKNGRNLTTGLPIDVMFCSRVGFLAELRFLP